MLRRKYSDVIERSGCNFRYNYEDSLLQWITDNGEVIDEVGFSRLNFENPGVCDAYIDDWMRQEEDEIRWELAFMA